VTTVWTDERAYYPVHAVPYTPASHFATGKGDAGFRAKLKIAADLAIRAQAAGLAFRAVAADSAYGDQDDFRAELAEAGLPFVMALKPRRGTWAYRENAHTPGDAVRGLLWGGPGEPGEWQSVTRAFRDGDTEAWWAADATLAERGGGRTAPGGWWWRPPIRTPCQAKRSGTWSRTCPGPAAPVSGKVPGQPQTWPRSCGSTGCATEWSKATSRSRTSSAGPTSRSAPTSPSAATRH
jgi:DDE superfamily endonuclease